MTGPDQAPKPDHFAEAGLVNGQLTTVGQVG